MPLQIIECEQGSPEWHAARLGIITASCMSHVLAKGQGKTRNTYMLKLIGEIFTGQQAESYSNAHMERGKEQEAAAREVYASTVEEEVTQCGFIRNHDEIGGVGCSPDALVGAVGGAEIKTRLAHLQAELLLDGRVPSEHAAQIQTNLWVAERQWWDFVSYCPGMPLFRQRVYRDENLIGTMRFETISFYGDMKRKIETIKNIRMY